MSHYILQVLDIHARTCHIGTKCVTEHMGRDMGKRFIRVQLLVFLHSLAYFVFNMQRYFRLIILIQQKETTISVHNDFRFHFLAAGKDIFQTLKNFIRHRNITAATFCLGFLDIIFPATFPDKLVVYPDSLAFKVQIALCQTAKLADTHTSSQQNHKFIIILRTGFIFLDKAHPKFLLFRCHGNPLL